MDIGPIKLLIFVLLGFGLVLGLISRKKVGKSIGRIIFFPILILFAYSFIKNTLSQFSPHEQIFYIVIVIFFILLILIMTTHFGREVLASFVGTFLYDIFKGIFKIIGGFWGWIFRLFRRR